MTLRGLSIGAAGIMAAVAASLIGYGMAGAASGLAQQPRDPRPNEARSATKGEKQLETVVASAPHDWRAAQELAKLQERRGALAEAEATLRRSAEAAPTESARWVALAAFYNRSGQFERAIETLEGAADRAPSQASAHHLVATFYFAKLSDPALRPDDRLSYITRGLAAEERALAAEPDFFDAIVHKSLFLRAQAEHESNPARRAALIQQADDVRSRAAQSWRTARGVPPAEADNPLAYPAPPPPPPVPGAGEIEWVYGETSFAAADGTTPPKKLNDVRPVYPPMAIRLGIQGRVIVQATIDARGHVVKARVVESIPLLDSPTIEALRRWRFDPATIPSGADAVVINVEARFFPEK